VRSPLGLMMMWPWLCQRLLASFLRVSSSFRGQAWLDQLSRRCYGSTVIWWSSFGVSVAVIRWTVNGFMVTEAWK
jgi:hypothetical protein